LNEALQSHCTHVLIHASKSGLVKANRKSASHRRKSASLPGMRATSGHHKARRQPIRKGGQSKHSQRRKAGYSTKRNGQLKREIARRKAGEVAIRKGKIQFHNLFLESRLMEEKLRNLTRQLISAQEDERREISRELHDGIVQKLVAINIGLSALSAGSSTGTPIPKAKIARIQRLVANVVKVAHRFARELRPAVLDDVGLIPALYAYSKSLAARKKLKIQLTAFDGIEALGTAKRTVLFRVAQEALTNVARHAHATKVGLSITKIPGAIRMEISDNGRSFHVGAVLLAKNPKRLGLIGMKERVEMVGGRLSIVSAPGKGTIVRAEIPLEDGEQEK
jgi:signal transduction histidine kinase